LSIKFDITDIFIKNLNTFNKCFMDNYILYKN